MSFLSRYFSVSSSHFVQLTAAIKSKLIELNQSPAFDAQNQKMANECTSRAAVFIPLCLHNGVPSIMFTKRVMNLRNHAGQVSFPGGKIDDSDANEIYTAIRELKEEVNVAEKVCLFYICKF